MTRVLEGLGTLVDDAALITGSDPYVTPRERRFGPDSGDDYVLFPSASRVRVLLPASRRAASAAVLRFCDSNTPSDRVVRVGLGAMLRMGTGWWLRDRVTLPAAEGTVFSQLRSYFQSDVVIAIPIGAARANRKAVVQVLSREGATLAFAKVARSPLARKLIQNEARVLRFLQGRLDSLEVPRVLLDRSTADWCLLLLSPVPTPLIRTRHASRLPEQQMREVFEVAGVRQGALNSAMQALETRVLSKAPPSSDTTRRFVSALSVLRRESNGIRVDLGSCHGDWGPWNMASGRRSVSVWDWERFTGDTPRGFDQLHFVLQPRIASDAYRRAPSLLLEDATRALASTGITDRRQTGATTAAYLASIAGRYLEDRETEHGSALMGQLEIVLTLLEAQVELQSNDGSQGLRR